MTSNIAPDRNPAIRIERLNTDKSRKDVGSATVYHLYFELSASPPLEWRNLFVQEWERLHPDRKAEIDSSFLVIHSEISEVAGTLLPALKELAERTNVAYGQYAIKEASALELREDVWRNERKEIEALAATLHFDEEPPSRGKT